MFSSCDKYYLQDTYTLTPEELQYLSYAEDDQVVFSNSGTGEKLIFTTSPTSTEMVEIPLGINTNKYYLYEKKQQVLTSQVVTMGFVLEADRNYQKEASLDFFWDTGIADFPQAIESGFYVPIDSNIRYFKLSYCGSMMVQQHLYHDVYRGDFSMWAYPGDTTAIPVGAVYPLHYYFCLPDGMIRFDMSDSTSWELNR